MTPFELKLTETLDALRVLVDRYCEVAERHSDLLDALVARQDKLAEQVKAMVRVLEIRRGLEESLH